MRIFCLLALAASLAAAQSLPSRVTVGGNVQAAKLISSTPPVYPELAKQARIQGAVRLEVLISVDGIVTDIKVISGHPLLVQSTMEAVRTYQYSPTLLNDQPVEVATTVDVNFTLDGGPYSPGALELFTKGKLLSATEAAKLEQAPADKNARSQLLGYYTANKNIAARRQTLAWFVENDPTSPLNLQARYLTRGNSLSDPEGYQLLKSMWLNHRQLTAQNPQVVWNAASFLSMQDKQQAEMLYQLLQGGAKAISVNCTRWRCAA